MALPEYRLGPIDFVGMNGHIVPPMTIISLDERPGVEGTETTDEGIKGRPYTLRCWKDTASYSAARKEFLELTALVRSDPMELVFSDVSTFIDGYVVQVLSVREVNITRIKPGKNGINPPSLGWLEVDIDLLSLIG